MSLFEQMHMQWQAELVHLRQELDAIDTLIDQANVTPRYENIMRVFWQPPSSVKLLILGQDPYPGIGRAQGLAFSVASSMLPATLKNIFKELRTDIEKPLRTNGDLSDWSEQGVFLLNRVLTTTPETSLAHKDYGWQKITYEVARILGRNHSVAILWGKSAGELRGVFASSQVIESAHPSPLSAYRGFFGSKPFSRANALLASQGKSMINWQ